MLYECLRPLSRDCRKLWPRTRLCKSNKLPRVPLLHQLPRPTTRVVSACITMLLMARVRRASLVRAAVTPRRWVTLLPLQSGQAKSLPPKHHTSSPDRLNRRAHRLRDRCKRARTSVRPIRACPRHLKGPRGVALLQLRTTRSRPCLRQHGTSSAPSWPQSRRRKQPKPCLRSSRSCKQTHSRHSQPGPYQSNHNAR